MGTKTYGKQTAIKFSTYEELQFIVNESKPYFLIKMCDKFEVADTRFRIPDNTAFIKWMPSTGKAF